MSLRIAQCYQWYWRRPGFRVKSPPFLFPARG